MSKRAKRDVGFDLDRAIRTLHELALAEGALDRNSLSAPNPLATAMAHAFKHGVQVDRCTASPCRLGGICWALFELALYKRELEGAAGASAKAADATEQFRTVMVTGFVDYVRGIVPLIKATKARHSAEADAGMPKPMHAHAVLCESPREIFGLANDLLKKLGSNAADLRGLCESNELRQSSATKRRTLLLTAVYQHLRWGGLSYAEIARRVPDRFGTKGAVERVRNRVHGDDARSLHPIELCIGPEESSMPDSSA